MWLEPPKLVVDERQELLEAELSKLLGGRKVDLVTQRSLNHRLRDRVLASAQVEYAAG